MEINIVVYNEEEKKIFLGKRYETYTLNTFVEDDIKDITFIHLGGAGTRDDFKEALTEYCVEEKRWESERVRNLVPISGGCININSGDIGCRLANATYNLLRSKEVEEIGKILDEEISKIGKKLIDALKEIWWDSVNDDVIEGVIDFIEGKIGFEWERMENLIVNNCENNKSENTNIKIIANACISFNEIKKFIDENDAIKKENNLVIIQVPLYINEKIYFYNGERWEIYESDEKSVEPLDITDLWVKEGVQFIYIVKKGDKFELSLDKDNNTYTDGKEKITVLIGGHGKHEGLINELESMWRWMSLLGEEGYQRESIKNKVDEKKRNINELLENVIWIITPYKQKMDAVKDVIDIDGEDITQHRKNLRENIDMLQRILEEL